jgi:hypothetical protein
VPVLNGYAPGSTCVSQQVPAADLVSVTSITTVDATIMPTITINTPTAGQQFDQGQVTLADFTCSDGAGVGIAICSGPTKLDTTHVGPATFTVTAADYAGNVTTKSVHYVVDPNPPPPPPPHKVPLSFYKPTSLSRSGIVTVYLRCRALRGCTGKLSLAAGMRRAVVGSSRYSLADGHTTKVKIVLRPAGKALVKNGQLGLWLTIRPSGKHRASTRHLSLRAS